jgi:hypothetical protein
MEKLKVRAINYLKNFKYCSLLIVALMLFAIVFTPAQANAEGTTQMNEMQSISYNTDIYIDILNAGEVINI